MKNKITTLLLLGVCSFVYAQNSISGFITDNENNPLFGVEIYAPELHIGTTSDLDGRYDLKNLPHGDIKIIFSYFGYKSVMKEFDLHENIDGLEITLNETVFNIDEVIISTPFNRLQSKNVMKVESAKVKTLRQEGAATLIEGIEKIPGVSQISTGTSIGKPVIRGLSGNRVLIYTQGVRLENQQFGDEHGLGLNDSGIESVEVIKGPASLLYGSDALGGVIYFNPERFANENSFSSDVSQQFFSNTLGFSTSIGLKKSYSKWKFLARGTVDSHSDYKIPDGDRVTNTRYNEFNFNTGVGFNSADFSSELRYNFNRSKVGLTEGIDEQTKVKNPEVPYQDIHNHILSLHNHFYFDTSKLDINLGYILNDRDEFEEHHDFEHHDEEDIHEDEEPALSMKLKTFNYDLKYHFPKLNKLELIVGAQGMLQKNKNFGEEILIPDAEINDMGILSTGIIDFENSSLQAGIRFDTRNLKTEEHQDEHDEHDDHEHDFEAIDRTYNNFTGSLGYKLNFSEHLISRINLASGYRAPNLAELTSFGVHHGTNRFEIGNPNLKSEQNFQTDIAIEYENKHIEFFINGFYNYINDYIFLMPTGEIIDDVNVFEYTQSNAKLFGGEIGFHLHPHPIDWLHLESSYETVTGKQNNGDYLPLIPANQWNNTIRSEFNIKEWLKNGYGTINIVSTFEQNKVSQFEESSNGYTLLNLSAGGNLQFKNVKFNLSLNLNNALNTSYVSHLSRLKVDDIDNIGRNFIIGVQFNL